MKFAINEYQKGLACMVYKLFEKKTQSEAIATSKVGTIVNERLALELQKPRIKEALTRWRFYAKFKDNIWSADLLEMASLCFKCQGVEYL